MKIKDGVKLQVIHTKKFKDIGISIRFQNSLEKKKASARSLLALMMCDRCQKYDTKQKMSMKQDELYGMTLYAQSVGYGKSQVVELRSKCLHPAYLKQQDDYLYEVFSFLHEVLFNPLLVDEVFEESKKILLAKLQRLHDDPAQYVISEGLKEVGKNGTLEISSLGSKEDVEALTLDDMKQAYQELIQDDVIHIMICGDIQEAEVTSYIQKFLDFTPRIHTYESHYVIQNQVKQHYIESHRNITQSYLMMVWFTNTSVLDDTYYALRVANAMLGQYSTSLLFQEVREKRSLCYSISSSLISYDGVLAVTTGIQKEHIEETVSLIKEQVKRLQDGEFDDELMEVSKIMIINSLKTSRDSMYSLMALAYQNTLLQRDWSVDDMISQVQQVSKQQVMHMMRQCDEQLTYVLTHKEVKHEEN